MQSKNKRSIPKKLQTPEFESEAEEARWYEKNQDSLMTEFKDAAKHGTLGRDTLAKRGLTLHNKKTRKDKIVADPVTGCRC